MVSKFIQLFLATILSFIITMVITFAATPFTCDKGYIGNTPPQFYDSICYGVPFWIQGTTFILMIIFAGYFIFTQKHNIKIGNYNFTYGNLLLLILVLIVGLLVFIIPVLHSRIPITTN